MKIKSAAFLIIFGLAALVSFAQEFGYPVQGEPWYFIRAQVSPAAGMKAVPWKVIRAEVNGQRCRDFVLFQNGKELLSNEFQGNLPFEIKCRHGWQGGKAYEIKVDVEEAATKKTLTLGQKSTSPAERGYWDRSWKNYLSLMVAEENGFERKKFPVHATFGILSGYWKTPDEIRVVKAEKKDGGIAYTEIPCQVYDVKKWEDKKLLSAVERDEKTNAVITRYHATTSFSVAFLADLQAHEKATYLVFYNNPGAAKPDYPTDLKVSGTGIGKTVENRFYKAVLHSKSGVLYELTDKPSGIKIEHKLETNGSVHWNPCVYSPPHAWYHTSDWEYPPFTEISGPLFYSIRIAAPLPFYKDVVSSVTYYFYAGSPFILAETTIHILDDLFVQALRNGEVVFNKDVFDRAAYKTTDGKVNTIDLTRTRMHPEHAVSLRPDTPWVTFYSEAKNFAFANMYLEVAMTNLGGGQASAQQPFLYIQNGPWYYLARGLVYSFGTNNQTRMLPVKKGSVYYEKVGWLPLSYPKDRSFSADVDLCFNAFKYPLSILESIETYPESPEGWVVPILTEPFDEGVEEAIGSKAEK